MTSDFTFVGETTFSPEDLTVVVGSFELGEGHDTIWIRVTQMSEITNPPFSYGILGWESENGYELGSTKAFGRAESEIYVLGVGRSPSKRTGDITFKPRGFNLGWIREGTEWKLRFSAASGKTSSVNATRAGAITNSFVDKSNNDVSLVRVDMP